MEIEYERMRGDVLRLRERIDGIRETAESDDGTITVSVDGRGRLVDLRLAARVYRMPDSRALAAGIVETASHATELVGGRLAEITRDLFAADTGRGTAR
ncbi:YbaB/EbfC family nucleoid-associated protein [Spirillospora sp. NBC_00431]